MCGGRECRSLWRMEPRVFSSRKLGFAVPWFVLGFLLFAFSAEAKLRDEKPDPRQP
jgi:hypothetical protein